jgi:hypothetical protein
MKRLNRSVFFNSILITLILTILSSKFEVRLNQLPLTQNDIKYDSNPADRYAQIDYRQQGGK